MDNLIVRIENCYGISSLDETFDLSNARGKAKAYSIYAPNGLMKTSFSKTFDALSKGEQPKEERFNRQPTCIIKVDNVDIQKEQIYVLKSEVEISSDNEAVTNILINQDSKSRYDSLVSNINKLKSKLETSLQKKSKIKKGDVEDKLIKDFQTDDFVKAIELAKGIVIGDDLESFIYNEIFDPKAISIIESP